jgi:hypothetical protein
VWGVDVFSSIKVSLGGKDLLKLPTRQCFVLFSGLNALSPLALYGSVRTQCNKTWMMELLPRIPLPRTRSRAGP